LTRIEGYASSLSVEPGEKIAFHISSSTSPISVEIARVGAGRDVVWETADLDCGSHAIPADAAANGCGWPSCLELTIPTGWRSGNYIARLQGQDDGATVGQLSFVVRSAHPGRDAKILLQRSTNTDNAYNSYGGSTFYNGPHGPSRRLSFDRPFAGFPGCGELLFTMSPDCRADLDDRHLSTELRAAFAEVTEELSRYAFVTIDEPGSRWHIHDTSKLFALTRRGEEAKIETAFSTWSSCWHHWERHFVRWAEKSGYQIDYAVNGDLELHPEILDKYRLVLSVGHDEYWSAEMRDHLESFIERGGNVAFFSGNVAWWQVRSEEDGRALVCWKEEFDRDPAYVSGQTDIKSTLWCHHLINRPENHMTGVSFAYGGYHSFFDQHQNGPNAYTVHRPEHWLFAGTGLQRGELLGSRDKIVNYECDGCQMEYKEGLPVPTHADGTPSTFEILATAPAALSAADDSMTLAQEALYGKGVTRISQPGAAVLGTYTRGGTVVTSGCTDWSLGLRGNDPKVEQITRTVLDRLSG
jgi:hypothetical protein